MALFIDNKYKILKKIGKGSFGLVFKVINVDMNKVFAIKIEEKKKEKESKLKNEYKLYNLLKEVKGIPKVIEFKESKKWNILIMEHLGMSLENLFKRCQKKFSLKTVLIIGLQIFSIIEKLHNKGIIHRDIKPDNFLIDKNNKYIYLIDLGLSKYYKNKNKHNEYKKKIGFIGSLRYSSLKTHEGIEQSRRDDLESIGYMLIFFLKSKLPWQGLKSNNNNSIEKKNLIYLTKKKSSLKSLCSNIPICFYKYMKYVKMLKYKENHDYTYIKKLFIKLFKGKRYKYDYNYDWINKK